MWPELCGEKMRASARVVGVPALWYHTAIKCSLGTMTGTGDKDRRGDINDAGEIFTNALEKTEERSIQILINGDISSNSNATKIAGFKGGPYSRFKTLSFQALGFFRDHFSFDILNIEIRFPSRSPSPTKVKRRSVKSNRYTAKWAHTVAGWFPFDRCLSTKKTTVSTDACFAFADVQ